MNNEFQTSDALPKRVKGSGTMAMLYAIGVFVSLALSLVNIIRLFNSSETNNIPLVIFFLLISLAVSATFGILAFQYSSRAGWAAQSGTDEDYSRAFRALRTYFIYYGIIVILVLILLVILIIWFVLWVNGLQSRPY